MKKSFIGKLVFARDKKIGKDVLFIPNRNADGRIYTRHVMILDEQMRARIEDSAENDPYFQEIDLEGIRLATDIEKDAWDAESRKVMTPTAYLLAALVAGK